jgi:hypothetical protein
VLSCQGLRGSLCRSVLPCAVQQRPVRLQIVLQSQAPGRLHPPCPGVAHRPRLGLCTRSTGGHLASGRPIRPPPRCPRPGRRARFGGLE